MSEYRTIPLTKGKMSIVDDDDYERLRLANWHAFADGKGNFYASNWTLGSMHRVIMGLVKGDPRHVDHRNHNTLDNRKENLRVATRQQNMSNQRMHSRNKTGLKGIYWHERDKVWRAKIGVNRKSIWLGDFKSPEAAHAAYCAAAIKYHGEFAKLS